MDTVILFCLGHSVHDTSSVSDCTGIAKIITDGFAGEFGNVICNCCRAWFTRNDFLEMFGGSTGEATSSLFLQDTEHWTKSCCTIGGEVTSHGRFNSGTTVVFGEICNAYATSSVGTDVSTGFVGDNIDMTGISIHIVGRAVPATFVESVSMFSAVIANEWLAFSFSGLWIKMSENYFQIPEMGENV